MHNILSRNSTIDVKVDPFDGMGDLDFIFTTNNQSSGCAKDRQNKKNLLPCYKKNK